MSDDDKKTRAKTRKSGDEAEPEDADRGAADQPVARAAPGHRWLTTTELEALRGRLKKRFHSR
jgi:hypothetical protein